MTRWRFWRLKRLICWYIQRVERYGVDEAVLHVNPPELRNARAKISREIEALAEPRRRIP